MPNLNRLLHKDVEILETKILYQGFLRIEKHHLRHRLFKGEWSPVFDRELVNRYRVAAILPYDPKLKKVVLIEQFRISALQDENSPWLLELIAGIMTKEQSLEDLARSEAHEEAGLEIQKLIPICDYWVSPGATNERVVLYCAIVDATHAGGLHGLTEEHEDIRVNVFPIEEAFAMVRSGRINNAATIIALQWLELKITQSSKRF